jgi:hypothetical protein
VPDSRRNSNGAADKGNSAPQVPVVRVVRVVLAVSVAPVVRVVPAVRAVPVARAATPVHARVADARKATSRAILRLRTRSRA